MKHILNFIFPIAFLMFGAGQLDAQKDMGSGSGIVVKGTAIGSQVTLKWMPENPDLFQAARISGYKIVRYTITNAAGQNLSEEVSRDTKVTIASQVKPISISKWDSITGGTHAYDSLMRFGYLSQAFDFQPSGTKLADAIEYREKKKNAYIYASLISDSDVNLAKYLGLAYTDVTAAAGIKYRYFVTINGQTASGMALVEPMDISQLPVATDLEASVSDKKINITWNSEGLSEYYTYYDIFRSDNGGATYIKANTSPFIYMGEQEKDDFTISFGDVVPSNGVVYTYKIRGISPYGFDGPFSDTISAVAIPSRLNMETAINNITFDPNGTATINWHLIGKDSLGGLPVDFTAYIDRFDLLYRSDLTDTALVINTQPIESTITQFTIPAPARQGLYFIRATDIYDYEYTSTPILGQIKDSIPPAIPVGLAATMTPDGRVKLTWTANSDTDLLGYKIYMAFGTVNPFTQMTSTHVVGTEYKTTIKDDNANDSIFYKISAVDQRYNISELSESVLLLIPDRTPPSSPVLKRITATADGMRIAWALSESDDLQRHYLQRKFKTAVEWVNVLDIPANDPKYSPLPLIEGEFEPANYIDTTTLELRVYDYRLMAVDSSNNRSVSQVISLKPYDDGKRGTIRLYDAKLVPLGAVYNPTIGPPASATPGTIQTFFPDITDLNDPKNVDPNGPRPKTPQKRAKTNVVRLEWQYETDFPSSVVSFQIYQKKASSTPGNISQAIPTNPPFVLVRTVSVRDAKLIANVNNLNTYVVFIEDIPGRKEVTTPAEYKIIAKYQDGGFSLPAIDSVIIPPITF